MSAPTTKTKHKAIQNLMISLTTQLNDRIRTAKTTPVKLIALIRSVGLGVLLLLTANAWAMGTKPPATNPQSVAAASPATAGVVTTRYGDKTWDTYAWLGAHNAFASYGAGHGAWILGNQRKSYEELLDAGVRNLDLDIHEFKSATWQCVASLGQDFYGQDIYLCHGNCSVVPGIHYALPRKTLSDALDRVAKWLRANPEAVVTLTLEDYVQTRSLYLSTVQRSNAYALIFNPYTDRVNGKWPKLSEMVRQNKRLVILTDAAANAGKDTATALDSDVLTKNYWSIGSSGDSLGCRERWGNIPLSSAGRAFHMSHFRDVPTAITAKIDNARTKLRARIMNECYASARRYPNFLVLDFSDIGDGKEVVDWLNTPGVSP